MENICHSEQANIALYFLFVKKKLNKFLYSSSLVLCMSTAGSQPQTLPLYAVCASNMWLYMEILWQQKHTQ